MYALRFLKIRGELQGLRRQCLLFARKFCRIDFFLKVFPLKDDELVMSEM